jgi:hypothetical protein
MNPWPHELFGTADHRFSLESQKETAGTQSRFLRTGFGLNASMAIIGMAAVFLWANIVFKHLTDGTINLPSGRIFFEFSPDCRPIKSTIIHSPILTIRNRVSTVQTFDLRGLPQVQNVLDAVREGFGTALQIKPVRLEFSHQTPVQLALVRGGRPVSLLSTFRMGVSEFVRQSRAVAGINGAFFVDASLTGTNNSLIGPYQTEAKPQFQVEHNPAVLKRINKRPLVLWGAKRIAIVAFQPKTMNSSALLNLIVPDLKDAFLGGAWILKHGRVFTDTELLERPAPKDVNDVRPRVFFGVTKHGEVQLGASLNPTSSSDLARAALAAGVFEAVLLDSGYSTSMIYQDQIIAVGRHNAQVPSRPVPHAIVLMDDFKANSR